MANNPDLPPEIIRMILDKVYMVRDLLNWMCVNRVWYAEVAKKLYSGSLIDMKHRTPSIASLDSLFVSSNKRFAHNMGFVKHLILAPERPTTGALGGSEKFACFEKCRALSDYKHAGLFPVEGGPTSITIPFNIVNSDPRTLLKLLLIPTVEYMAIDNVYSLLLMDSAFDTPETPLPNKFSNLKALSIYGSKIDQDIDHLDRFLDRCDLQFFHFEVVHENDNPASSNMVLFSQCLGKQKNIKALSLQTCCYGIPLAPAKSTKKRNKKLWPGLKVLDLLHAKQDWLEHCPKFQQLQILRPRFREDETIDNKYLPKCRNLRVLDISVAEVESLDVFLDIAHGCPLLQKLTVEVREIEEINPPQFSSIARALPLLEVLSLNFFFEMEGETLTQLAQSCPQLTILDLPESILVLSLFDLANEMTPFEKLETMRFQTVVFLQLEFRNATKSKDMSDESEGDHSSENDEDVPLGEDDTRGEPDDTSGGRDEDLSLNDEDDMRELADTCGRLAEDLPHYDDDDDEDMSEDDEDMSEDDEDDFKRRMRIWEQLGYVENSPTHECIQHAWQANMEIATVGWPVVHERMFRVPHEYCSTTPKGFFYG